MLAFFINVFSKAFKRRKLSQIIFIEALFLIGLQPQFLFFYTDPFHSYFLTSLLCCLAIIKSSSKKIYPWFLLVLFLTLLPKLESLFLSISLLLYSYCLSIPYFRQNK